MKSRYGIRENEPMSMFCGLPVMLATLPIFEAVATARRYGSGLMPIRRVSASTIGTMTRQMMSLTKNADSTPLAQLHFHLHHQHRFPSHLRPTTFLRPPPSKLGHDVFQLAIFLLQCPQPPRLVHVHAAVLRLPPVETRSRDPVPPAQLFRFHPSFRFLQDGYALFFAESTLAHDSSSDPGRVILNGEVTFPLD